MKFFNVRVWLLILRTLALIGGIGNAVTAETVATDSWGEIDGRLLDVATSLEIAWGIHLSVWGASVIVISVLLHGAERARFGAVSVIAVLLSQIIAALSIGNLGYGEGGRPPVLFLLIVLVIAAITLVACIREWNGKKELLSGDTSV